MRLIDTLRDLLNQHPHIDKVYLNAAGTDYCLTGTPTFCHEISRAEVFGEEREIEVDELIMQMNPELEEHGVKVGDTIGVTVEGVLEGGAIADEQNPGIITELPPPPPEPAPAYEDAFPKKRGTRKKQ